MAQQRTWLPWLLLALLPVLAHAPALTPWFRFDPLFVVSGLTEGTWQTNGVLGGYPGWIDGNAGVTTEALGRLAADGWLAGRVPWWNSFSGVGMPLVAEGQTTAMFLPFGLLLALPHGLLLLRIVLCALAGLFTQALLRRMGLAVLPALLGAMLFELNGTFAWFAHGPIMPVAFLPLLLLGVEQARDGRFPVAAGLGTAWSFLAGFPETAALNLAFAGVWACVRWVQAPVRLGYALRVGAAVAGGLLVAAPAILPFVEALPREFLSGHAGVMGGGWRRENLALLLFPYSHGNLMADLARGPATAWAWFRTGGFVDLPLACLALAALRRRAPDVGLRCVLAGWVAVTAAKAAGFAPAVALFGLLPLLREANVHLYMMSSWSMAAAVLAACTVGDWQAGRRPRWGVALCVLGPLGVLGVAWSWDSILAAPRWLALAGVLGPVAVALAAWWLTRGVAPAGRQRLLAAVLGANALALFALPLLAGTHGRRLDVAAIRFLQTKAGLGRVVSFGPLVPNYGAMFGIAEISHNYLPVPQIWVDAIRERLQPGSDGVNFYTGGVPPAAELARMLPAYQAMGVAYALTWPWQDLGAGGTLVFSDRVAKIWSLPAPAPYWAAEGCRVSGGRERIEAACDRPATLVRRELFWPGWSATVNGAPAAIARDDIFQRVALPAGQSVVAFRYAPPGIAYAWAAFAVGALLLLAGSARHLPWMTRRLHRRNGVAPAGGAA